MIEKIRAGAMAFGLLLVCTAVANADHLTVRSSDPFNFVAALADPVPNQSVTLSVDLEFADNGQPSERLPALLFVHGSGGPLPHHEIWLSWFRSLGMATAQADHFEPRGKASAVGGHIRLTGAAMAVDALNILNALATHPRIDPDRIAIMGASKGGGVTLYTAWKPLQQAIAPDHTFAAHIALYPTCVRFEKPDMTGSPIIVIVGALDEWTGFRDCERSVADLRASGFADVGFHLLPGATHGFDSARPYRLVKNAYNVTECRFTITADGREIAGDDHMDTPKAKQRALSNCASKGASYGGDDAATALAKDHIAAFVSRVLAPERK